MRDHLDIALSIRPETRERLFIDTIEQPITFLIAKQEMGKIAHVPRAVCSYAGERGLFTIPYNISLKGASCGTIYPTTPGPLRTATTLDSTRDYSVRLSSRR
jgi:hypothetical protein